jgi:hypothetical protein
MFAHARRLARILAYVLCVAPACGGEQTSQSGMNGDGAAGSAAAAGASGYGGSGGSKFDSGTDAPSAGCAPNTIPLIVEAEAGSPIRYWVPIEYQGEPASLGIDTGSALTFLFLPPNSPRYVPHAGDIVVGCETLPVAGRNIDLGGSINGLPRVGLLGADFFLSRTVELDAQQEKLTRHAVGSVLPGTESWSTLPFDSVQGHIIAPVTLDAEPLRLMFDTGSPQIVWLGEPGRPGDQDVMVQDASGALLTFHRGPSLLEMAGEPARQIDVLRAPSWPYFESTVEALGGNIHGLVGLDVFAYRKLVFQPELEIIRIAPNE